MKGKVKFFSKEKGFGFIVADDGTEYFVGVREVVGADLPENSQIVEFEPKNGKKGPYASRVKIIEAGPRREDNRVTCPSCGKKIFPKLIHDRNFFGNPVPRKSLCPLCGGTVKNFGDCFIATAVYGNYDAPEVCFYRHYRDYVLKSTLHGKMFIYLYYRSSPYVVPVIKRMPYLIKRIQYVLDSIIKKESF